VEEVGRRVRVGEDVRQLLELERPFPRRRVLIATAEHDAAIDADLVLRDAADLGLRGEHGGQVLRNGAQRRARIGRAFEGRDEHRDRDQLGGVGLGRRDCPLRAGPQVDDMLRGHRQR
jgi:hypothetical protein